MAVAAFFSLLFSQIASVHQEKIIYNQGGDIKIENPEVLQTFYDQLGGGTRNYLINSGTGFNLNIKLSVPASSNYNGRYSAKVFLADQDVAFLDGQTSFAWKEFYNSFDREYYFLGPELAKPLPAGAYKITVFSYENRGKYILTVGKYQKFSFLNLLSAYFILPTLKLEFFQTSVWQFFLSPVGLILILILIVVLLFWACVNLAKFFAEKMGAERMPTILLTSSGMWGSKYDILSVLPKPAYNVRVAHIITASKPEEDKSYVEKDRELMREAQFNVEEIDIEGKNKGQLMNLLKDFDVIYVQGGNTFYLLKQMRQSGFDKVVKKLIKRGVVYVGVSAGSIVAGKTTVTAGWKDADKNIVHLKNLKGLRLVPFNIFVHYSPEWDETIKKEQKKSRHKLEILSDTQSILIQNKIITFLGSGERVIY